MLDINMSYAQGYCIYANERAGIAEKCIYRNIPTIATKEKIREMIDTCPNKMAIKIIEENERIESRKKLEHKV